MQFLADILAAPVDRPAVMETTALGAAYLAGYAGRRLSGSRRASRQPGGSSAASSRNGRATRERKWAGWQDAVRRTSARRVGKRIRNVR